MATGIAATGTATATETDKDTEIMTTGDMAEDIKEEAATTTDEDGRADAVMIKTIAVIGKEKEAETAGTAPEADKEEAEGDTVGTETETAFPNGFPRLTKDGGKILIRI